MDSHLTLPDHPLLADFQRYIHEMVAERGFQDEDVSQIFMLMVEECGELAKAIRRQENIHYDERSTIHSVAHEAADVFMYLLDICNHLSIDLEKAFREKEELNKQRSWKRGTV